MGWNTNFVILFLWTKYTRQLMACHKCQSYRRDTSDMTDANWRKIRKKNARNQRSSIREVKYRNGIWEFRIIFKNKWNKLTCSEPESSHRSRLPSSCSCWAAGAASSIRLSSLKPSKKKPYAFKWTNVFYVICVCFE